MSRSLLRSALELRTPLVRLPPSFLLPIGTRLFATTSPVVEPEAAAPPSTTARSTIQGRKPPTAPELPLTPLNPSPSVAQLLPLLRAQPNHYIRAHIHGFPYLVTEGDQVRLPFKMPGVVPGDVLRLNRASVLGSRDYTMKGEPFIDERFYECRATVLGTESEPLRVKVKTKRRNRRSQNVTSKHKYTVLRISELKISDVN